MLAARRGGFSIQAANGHTEAVDETPFDLKALLFDCDGERWPPPYPDADDDSRLHSNTAPNMVGCCAGVIVLSEDLHRIAYNAAFEHFEVRCNGEGSFANWQVHTPCLLCPSSHVSCAHCVALCLCPSHQLLTGESPCRSVEFYDKLQNTVGGGKPKMRWFFGERHLSTHIKMAMHE